MNYRKIILSEMSKTELTSKEINKMNDIQIIDVIQKYPFPEQWKNQQAWNELEYKWKLIKNLDQRMKLKQKQIHGDE